MSLDPMRCIALVAGAATPAGRAAAKALGARGIRLVLTDVNADHLSAVVEECRGAGYAALERTLAVTHSDAWSDLLDTIQNSVGVVQILVNAAEYAPRADAVDRPEAWRSAIEINLIGVVEGIAAVAHRLRAAGLPGHIAVLMGDEDAFQSGRSGAVGVVDGLRPALRAAQIELSLLDVRALALDQVEDAVGALFEHEENARVV